MIKDGAKPHQALRVLAEANEPLREDEVWAKAKTGNGNSSWHEALNTLRLHEYAQRLGRRGAYHWQITDAGRRRLGEGTMSAVEHPEHYGGDVPTEPIKVIRKWALNFALGNAVKYVARAGKKDPAKRLEDLQKARFYLDDEIAFEKNGGHRSAVVGITDAEIEALVSAMPVSSKSQDAWSILRRLHEEAALARII